MTAVSLSSRLRAATMPLAIWLRERLPRESWLYQRLRAVSRRFVLNNDPAELMVRAYARVASEVYFVQVGSNDGEQLDPLRWSILQRGWHGIMIEPVPYVFQRLQKNYGKVPGVQLANVAIADKAGELPFYHLREKGKDEQLPSYYDALGSFRKDVVLKHDFLIPDIAERLLTSMVRATTFAGLLAEHQVRRLDILHVDTEGYDYEILKQVDFARWEIPLLLYESMHLSVEDRAECEEMLRRAGYDLLSTEMDTVALRVNGPRPLPATLVQRFGQLKAQAAV